MAETLSEQVRQLLGKPILAHVATVMPNGSPQVTPMWIDTDGEQVLLNTSEGRFKVRNMRRNPHIAISMADPTDPFRGAVQIRGQVVEITPDGADAHIDRLAKKYTGAITYQRRRPNEVRLIVKVRPERITGGATRG